MSFLTDNTVASYKDEPAISVFYGRHGMGKTTVACLGFPKPFLANTEKTTPIGVNVPSMRIGSGKELYDLVKALMEEDHDYETLIIDTLDTYETMLERMVCEEQGWASIESPDYGAGYVEAASRFGYLMQGLQKLRDKKRMHIVILCHVEVTRFDDPRHGSYSVYDLSVRKRIKPIVSNLADAIFFMSQDPSVEKKKGEATAKAKSSQNVFLFTQPSPSFNAKNPWEMPAKVLVPKDDPASAISAHFPGFGSAGQPQHKEAA